jgi:hypothetical protein
MPALADKSLADSVKTELQSIRAAHDSEAGVLEPLKSLLALVSPTGGTGIMSTALQTPAARTATHLAIQKLVVAIERGARSEVEDLWRAALAAAQAWCGATRSAT